jgi:hypothetical protein
MADDLKHIRTCIPVADPETGLSYDTQALGKDPAERAALIKASRWTPGAIIKISFLDGEKSVQDKVVHHAKTWLDYANLNFYFGTDAKSDIRISFRYQGSWSTVGTRCHAVPPNQPTMNFGWLNAQTADEEYSRVVIHEFGHALGLIHEHQNPAAHLQWNKELVYKYFMGPPNNWTKEQIDHNLFETYAKKLTQYTEFDLHSIMLYPLPKEFTLDHLEIPMNRTLSEMDKTFIKKEYPA